MKGGFRSVGFVLDHALRKALKPFHDARWRAAKAPFRRRAAKGLVFELHPGDVVDYYIYTEGLFEKRFLFLVERLFNGGVALDVGANIGNHALFLARVFDEVHAFEPNPAMLARLERHIAMNAATNVRIHPFGLSDRDGKLPFYEHPGQNPGAGRFLAEGSPTKTLLPVRRGDDVLRDSGAGSIDFVKVDVEGHELAVLAGLAQTIAAHRPAVGFEFHPREFPAGYFEKFRAALPGYRFFECDLRPARSGFLFQAAEFLRRGGLPRLVELREIAVKPYPHILAVPADWRPPSGAPFPGRSAMSSE
jgi:FkbM family methyltransferase